MKKSYKDKPAIHEDVLVGQNLYSLAVVQLAWGRCKNSCSKTHVSQLLIPLTRIALVQKSWMLNDSRVY